MIRKGARLIVWDSTLEDMYTAIAEQDEPDELNRHPLVRICSVILYPIQHAAMFPDQASNHAPLPEGTVCRLKMICPGWLCFDTAYGPSLEAARAQLEESLRGYEGRPGSRMEAAARESLQMLQQHRRGLYPPRSVMGRDAPYTLPATRNSEPCPTREAAGAETR